MEKQKLVKQTVEQTIVSETGEIIERRVTQTFMATKARPFVKWYLDSLIMRRLTGSAWGFMYQTLSYFGYNGLIELSPLRNKLICEAMGVSDDTFKRALNKLVDKGIFARLETNVYFPNPHIFERGKRKDCDELRAGVSLNDKGKMVLMNWLKNKLITGRGAPEPIKLLGNSPQVGE